MEVFVGLGVKLLIPCRDSLGLQGQASGQVNIDSSMPAAELLKPLAHKILTEGFTSPEVRPLPLDLFS